MPYIPVVHEASAQIRKPILQFKELEPDWERYNSWRASLIEPYAKWLRRRRKLRLDEGR